MRTALLHTAIARKALFLSAVLVGTNAQATATDLTAAAELAKNSGCFSCHSAHEKVVGPAFLSVAEKYAADKDAVPSLVQSIQMGSKGKWGRAPMPAHSSLSSEDLQTLATWVMATKPQ